MVTAGPCNTANVVRHGDRELVEDVLRRDRKATAEFVALHADALYRYIAHRLAPRADRVEDLVQEVFLAAWQSLPDYQGASSVRNWLLGIARHKVEDYYRARLREPEPLPDEEGLPQPAPQWDEMLDQEGVRKRTQHILATLPEAYSLVLLWRYWEKRSTQEMATATGKSEKSIERTLARAREQFRKKWEHE